MNAKKKIYCDECPECTYVGEGDFVCMNNEPFYVKIDWIPTEDYCKCNFEEDF